MSLSVKVQKDIGEYTEKVVGKMSLRTLACIAAGLASAVVTAALCHYALGIEVADASLPVMAAAIPFWLLGFWRPFHMRLEEFAPLWLDFHLEDQRLLLTPTPMLAVPGLGRVEPGRPSRKARRKAKRKGAELYVASKQQEE